MYRFLYRFRRFGNFVLYDKLPARPEPNLTLEKRHGNTVFSSSPRSSILTAMSEETTTLGVDDSLLESAARCLDLNSVRALSELQLDEAARARLDVLAQKANEGQLAPEEAREYDRFIDVSDIISTLRLKAERQVGDLALAQ
jgi:hypothetical protein